ncbi:ribonuclease E activity regulator RraA [Marinococcus halotolerans]|uniref:ribonuclease E activity regulator RraA n=1 Tax=Marinococcus halotolerans TaxID=301092 RepID=UPI0003B41050|nr:ribonuclease E activity regulator RraA [Marinococcus halotolerans]
MGRTADICDEYGNEVFVANEPFLSHGPARFFEGPIETVRVFEDNVLVEQALGDIPAGSVLVVDGGGSSRRALLGDNLAEIAVKRGLAGIIVNGAIRDSDELREMNIRVFSRFTNPRKSVKEGRGERSIPVDFADVTWTPGDYVYADSDGIVLLPARS